MTDGTTTEGITLRVHGAAEPTAEEMAAISAAASVLVLAPPATLDTTSTAPRWRFSGRWWVKPVPLRRRRPW